MAVAHRVVLVLLPHYTLAVALAFAEGPREPRQMPPINPLPWIFTAIVASIAAMVTGIQSGLPLLSWAAALLFALALVASAVDMNRPWWHADGVEPDARADAAIGNTRVLTLGYLWGALALLAIYRLTSVRWQHGLQYGAAMALIAWLMLVYVHLIANRSSRLRTQRALAWATWLALAHGVAALVGVAFLIGSGKILSAKGDWAANQIFLAGGLAVAALSAISCITQWRLSRSLSPIVGSELSRT